ncbi:sugar isomerase, AgaS family [Atopobium minutum]|uniref:Galactosamine 6-phosphate isomerase AgaS n=1 Tax=Atopobium minutum TaxID=1381 RepID=A0AB38A6A0_9ACTN|nr:SIS domain-containing protein [Atopobium minutum]KRN55565.1 sugar isomerase, AgaS family [Atopobium minutum]SEB63394.1 galactosamine 6-phosphate isomerase AgaS [Atopobium minutum]
MFDKARVEFKALGADITTHEIAQQPDLWLDTLDIYFANKEKIHAFLNCAKTLGKEGITDIIFTGAGTSAYVGDTLVPYLRRVGDASAFDFKAIPSTDIVSAPYNFLCPERPCVLVSFARSGNSPESLAAVEIARSVVHNIMFLNITCAPDGKLAVLSEGASDTLTLLIPGANDQGFAMTGSYSCMELLSALIFDGAKDDQKASWVAQAADMGKHVIAHEDEVTSWLTDDFERITYLGSGALGAMTREAQLKILELTAGKIATSFDTSMGYRHGPKSFVNHRTLVFVFVSNDSYTRHYDLDILHEIAADNIALHTVAIQQSAQTIFEGDAITFAKHATLLPDAYLALPFIMVAQTISLFTSLKVGNTPDTPSPTGTVNRVVKGVTIHEFEA